MTELCKEGCDLSHTVTVHTKILKKEDVEERGAVQFKMFIDVPECEQALESESVTKCVLCYCSI